MIFMTISILFSISRFVTLVHRKNPILKANHIFSDPIFENTYHQIIESSFSIGFWATSFGQFYDNYILLNTSLFYFSIEDTL